MDEDRKQMAIAAIEAVMVEYVDVFAEDIEMPYMVDWVLVAAHDSAADASVGKMCRMHKVYQSCYRTAGLLQVALDDARGLLVDGDD